MRQLNEVRRDVLERLAHAPDVFCFLDYDGTISPIAETPGAARPLPKIVTLLHEMARAPGLAVAIISGRPITDVRRYLDIPGLHYSGSHGLELQWANGPVVEIRDTTQLRSVLPTIRNRMEQVLADRPGLLLEEKRAGLACHYRLASRADAVVARRVLAGLVRAYLRKGVPLTLTHGHEVSEVRPTGVTKGNAVRMFLGARYARSLVVCIGDDRTDHDAFVAAPQDAITIHVGEFDPSIPAHYCVPGPPEVYRFLLEMLAVRADDDGAPRPWEIAS